MESNLASTRKKTCRFFKRGYCRANGTCRFRHVDATAANRIVSAKPPPTTTTRERTYAQVLAGAALDSETKQNAPIDAVPLNQSTNRVRCPYLKAGESTKCRHGILCIYDHGDLCHLCDCYCLHPSDEKQRRLHRIYCKRQQNINRVRWMLSKDKQCSVCYDVVTEKKCGDQRFGILPNCQHEFCMQCIQQWRRSNFAKEVIEGCPVCRVVSKFVIPSEYWVDSKKKKALIAKHKQVLKSKDCKYFRKGHGECMFGKKCFYRHRFAKGAKAKKALTLYRIFRAAANFTTQEPLDDSVYIDNISVNDIDISVGYSSSEDLVEEFGL